MRVLVLAQVWAQVGGRWRERGDSAWPRARSEGTRPAGGTVTSRWVQPGGASSLPAFAGDHEAGERQILDLNSQLFDTNDRGFPTVHCSVSSKVGCGLSLRRLRVPAQAFLVRDAGKLTKEAPPVLQDLLCSFPWISPLNWELSRDVFLSKPLTFRASDFLCVPNFHAGQRLTYLKVPG